MATHNQTLTDKITESRVFAIIAIDVTSDQTDSVDSSFNDDYESVTLTDDIIVLGIAYSIETCEDVTIDHSESGLTSSFNYATSQVWNEALDTLVQTFSVFIPEEHPIIFSERLDSLPVVLYDRGDSLPVIFHRKGFIIPEEDTLNMTDEVNVSYNQDKETKTPTIDSSNSTDKITINVSNNQTATVTTSFEYTIA